MVDRKRRNARPALEPMERREVLSSSILLATAAPLLQLSPAQEVAIASGLGRPAPAGHASHPGRVSALAGAGGTGGGVLPGSLGTGTVSFGNGNTGSAGSGLYNGGNNPQGIMFPGSPIVGAGTPTAAELAREKFVAKFSGPMTVQPGRFSDQKEILFLRGLGGSTPNFFLHGDYSLAIVIPTGFNPATPFGTGGTDPTVPGYVPPVTGFAFLDDKNNNSGGVFGLDLVATAFDAKGRPTTLSFTADPNVYGGIFFVDSGSGVVHIAYGKNSATTTFVGRIYTSGLTSPFQNVDLYAKHSG